MGKAGVLLKALNFIGLWIEQNISISIFFSYVSLSLSYLYPSAGRPFRYLCFIFCP